MSKQRKYCLVCDREQPSEAQVCPACGNKLHGLRDDDLTGKQIDGRYRVLCRLGQGGMGLVYKARHEALDRTVAIKVLRPELAPDEQFVKRFLLEARAVARLRNVHTVMVHDFGTTPEGFLYFAMEYCEGHSLHKVLRQEKKLPWQRAARIGAQVCESLAEAHEQGIYHRDIKPENIFLVAGSDGGDHVKVLDFGIAKLASAGEGTRLTRQGLVVGTPEYLSPEQASDKGVDHRSDLYSLGVALYEMVAGHRPFQSDSTASLLVMHLQKEPPPLPGEDGADKCPESFRQLIWKCLAKSPGDRPTSAPELGAALRSLCDAARPGETLAGPPVGTLSPVVAQPPVDLPVPTPGRTRGYEEANRFGLEPDEYLDVTHATTEGVPAGSRRWLWFGMAVGLGIAGVSAAAALGAFGGKTAPPATTDGQMQIPEAGAGEGGVAASPSLQVQAGSTGSQSSEVLPAVDVRSAIPGPAGADTAPQTADIGAAPVPPDTSSTAADIQAAVQADVRPQPSEDAATLGAPDVYRIEGPAGSDARASEKSGDSSKRQSLPEHKTGPGGKNGKPGTTGGTSSAEEEAGGKGGDFGDLPPDAKVKKSEFGDVPDGKK